MGNENLSLVLFIDENVYNDYTLGERDNDETRTRMICRHRKRKRKKEKGRKVGENGTEKEEKQAIDEIEIQGKRKRTIADRDEKVK